MTTSDPACSAEDLLRPIETVLMQTSHPGNIGSTARALKTMGLSRLCLAMLGFWYGQRDQASAADNRLGMRLAWAGMALAVMSKGLIGIVLPAAVLAAYSVPHDLMPRWFMLRKHIDFVRMGLFRRRGR